MKIFFFVLHFSHFHPWISTPIKFMSNIWLHICIITSVNRKYRMKEVRSDPQTDRNNCTFLNNDDNHYKSEFRADLHDSAAQVWFFWWRCLSPASAAYEETALNLRFMHDDKDLPRRKKRLLWTTCWSALPPSLVKLVCSHCSRWSDILRVWCVCGSFKRR